MDGSLYWGILYRLSRKAITLDEGYGQLGAGKRELDVSKCMKWFGREILPIRHRYNCQVNDPAYPPPLGALGRLLMKLHYAWHGVPTEGFRSSERAIEVPLAIDFLSHCVKDDSVVELGCVLPYYILKHQNHVVYDLADHHPDNVRMDIRLLTADELSGNVISISTLEHIGTGEYGIETGDVSAVDVLKRILANAKSYFITFPLGCNPSLDVFVANATNLNEKYVTRTAANPNDWMVVEKADLTDDMKQYGTYLRANTICVLMKGCS